MSYDNSNAGSLNPSREKRSERSPDWYGRLQISGEVLEALKAGQHVRIAGWNRTGSYGDFISIKAEVEKPRDPQKQARDQIPGQYDWKAAEAATKASTASQNHEAASTADFDDEVPF